MRRAEAIINFGIILVPVLLGVGISSFVGLPISELVLFAAALSFVAVALLFFAKLPILRAGIFFSLGPSPLPKHGKLLYFMSYGALFMALCAWVALAVTASFGAVGV